MKTSENQRVLDEISTMDKDRFILEEENTGPLFVWFLYKHWGILHLHLYVIS